MTVGILFHPFNVPILLTDSLLVWSRRVASGELEILESNRPEVIALGGGSNAVLRSTLLRKAIFLPGGPALAFSGPHRDIVQTINQLTDLWPNLNSNEREVESILKRFKAVAFAGTGISGSLVALQHSQMSWATGLINLAAETKIFGASWGSAAVQENW